MAVRPTKINGVALYKQPWYGSYHSMMDRCYRKTAKNYKFYLVQADKEGRSVVLPSEDAVFRQALEAYGPQAQTMMVMEEMAELAKELCKASRGLGSVEHIAEEIADVQITLEQMIILHQCQGLVERIRAEKVKRLLERMEKRTATDAPGQRREKVELP